MKFVTTDYSASEKVGRYRIDAGRRRRIEEYQGKTGLNDLKSILLSMASDPCWSAEYHGLIDFSEAELELTANDVLRLALVLRHETNRTNGWLAYVATKSTTYGITRGILVMQHPAGADFPEPPRGRGLVGNQHRPSASGIHPRRRRPSGIGASQCGVS